MTHRLRAAAARRSADTATGGYGYDRRIVAGLRALGWDVERARARCPFPAPTPRRARRRRGRARRDCRTARSRWSTASPSARCRTKPRAEAARLRLVALVHHPLAAETGLDPDRAGALHESENARARAPRAPSSSTSAATAQALRARLRRGRCTAHRDRARRDRSPAPPRGPARRAGPLQLLCVATLVPRKGHELLLRALAARGGDDWHARLRRQRSSATARCARRLRDARAMRCGCGPGQVPRRAARRRACRPLCSAPTCSCSRPGTRAMAWRSPKRSRTGCRSSRPRSARRRAWSATRPGCWCRRATCARSRGAAARARRRGAAHASCRGRRAPGAHALPRWPDAVGAVRGAARAGCARHERLQRRLARAARTGRHPRTRAGARAARCAASPRRARRGDRRRTRRAGPRRRHRRELPLPAAAPRRRAALDAGRITTARCCDAAADAASRGRAPTTARRRPRDDVDLLRRLSTSPPRWPAARRRGSSRPPRCSTWCPRRGSNAWRTAAVRRAPPCLFALTYDGRARCWPGDRDDALVIARVNRHQRTDKGFGPALGPTAATAAATQFTRAGYRLRRARSDWRIGPDDAALQARAARRLGRGGARDRARRDAAGRRLAAPAVAAPAARPLAPVRRSRGPGGLAAGLKPLACRRCGARRMAGRTAGTPLRPPAAGRGSPRRGCRRRGAARGRGRTARRCPCETRDAARAGSRTSDTVPGRRTVGRPAPISSGATVTCSRDQQARLQERRDRAGRRPRRTAAGSRARAARADRATGRGRRRPTLQARASRRRAVPPPRRASRARAAWARRDRVNRRSRGGEPAARIEHDAQRIRAGHLARRQLRVVRRHGAGADDHRIAERAHAVQVEDVVGAGDEARVAGFGRDEAVEALAEVADDQRVVGRDVEQRSIERQQRRDRARRRRPRIDRGAIRAGRRQGRIARRVEQALPAKVFGRCARLFQGPGFLPLGEYRPGA